MADNTRPFWKRLANNPVADTMAISSLMSQGIALERTVAAGINYAHGNSELADICMDQASNAALVSGLVSPGLLKAGAMLRNPAWLVPYSFRAATTALGITTPNMNILDTTVLDYAVYSVFGQAAMSSAVENKQSGKLKIHRETPVFNTLATLLNTTEGQQAVKDTIVYPFKAAGYVFNSCKEQGPINYISGQILDKSIAADPSFNYITRVVHHATVAALYFRAEAAHDPVANAAALGLTMYDVVSNLTIDRKEAKALGNQLMNWKNNLEIIGAFKRVPFLQENPLANIAFYGVNSLTAASSGLANTLWLKDKDDVIEYLGLKNLSENQDHRILALCLATSGFICSQLATEHSQLLDLLILSSGFGLMLEQHDSTKESEDESYGALYMRSRQYMCQFGLGKDNDPRER